MSTLWFTLGMAAGAVLTGAGAYVGYRRGVARVREAERRARGAERLAEIGSMTGGLAHEIKNPLSTIGLNVGLLVEAIEGLDVPPDERSRLLSRMKGLRRETDRLADILREFLEFAGKVHLERRPVDLSEVVGELVDFYLPEAERLGVRLRRDDGVKGVIASVDVRHFKQAVLNLMINATQAMTRPGAAGAGNGAGVKELILRVERAGGGAGGGGGGGSGSGGGGGGAGRAEARVHVIDTGPGIEPVVLEQIFKPYFTTKPGGSGLGLPMSRRLIEEHGGRIEVHSEVGRGTDFTVIVPLAPGGSDGSGGSGGPGGPGGR